MKKWWRDLSVSKKLYAVVGVMATLIALELFTLLFAMDTLSAVRSFVAAEGSWSKGQKDALHSLYLYIFTSNKKHYVEFYEKLEVPRADREARLELEKPEPDFALVTEHFRKGDIHENDIPGIIKLLVKFNNISYIANAVDIWKKADNLMSELMANADLVYGHISKKTVDTAKIKTAVREIDRLNRELTHLENEFSRTLGEGSRWLEGFLMVILICAVLTIESTGLYLTITFSKNLNRSLTEMAQAATQVGKGNFTQALPVRSKDELGQLAHAINKMSRDLENSIGKRKVAENANHTKTIFLANMSHEIRTPLGVILGLAELLKDPNLAWKDHAKYLETIERTGKNLNRIINDILDISKVETGHLEIELTEFSVTDFFNEIKSMMKVKADQDHNKLLFFTSQDAPEKIRTDRIRLKQILVNLINNALKFTKQGNISVVYSIYDDRVYFEVSDTGMGMSSEAQKEIFRPFSKIQNPTVGNYEGTGLGLVLSKRLAQDLGGDIELKNSEVGKGSTFLICVKMYNKRTLEKQQSSEKDEAMMSNADEKTFDDKELIGKKVLIVEDSVDNQLLLNVYLSKKAINVQFANNGQEGAKRAMEEDFDMVLMDMQMPIMDGYQATKYLREKGFSKPIVALTAHAMKEDKERCLQAGCDDYLTKPIASSILYRAIFKHTV